MRRCVSRSVAQARAFACRNRTLNVVPRPCSEHTALLPLRAGGGTLAQNRRGGGPVLEIGVVVARAAGLPSTAPSCANRRRHANGRENA